MQLSLQHFCLESRISVLVTHGNNTRVLYLISKQERFILGFACLSEISARCRKGFLHAGVSIEKIDSRKDQISAGYETPLINDEVTEACGRAYQLGTSGEK